MTLAIFLDKRRMTTKGENADRYHIKIRHTTTINKKTTQKYFLTNVFATEEEFKKIIGNPGKSRDLQEKKEIVDMVYAKARKILKDEPFIDSETFAGQLMTKGNFKDPLGLMEWYAGELEREGRIGSRDYYKAAKSSFKKFCGGVLSYVQVTPKWLRRYEVEMIEAGSSITTVGMYCIAMRTIFNLAIEKKEISPVIYPFGKGKYQIPRGKGRKLALNVEQKDKLISFNTLDPKLQLWVDLWKLSYFCNGMNFADILRLRFRDIRENVLVFVRTKTALTDRVQEPIEIPLREEVQKIINRHCNRDIRPENYIFPFLRDGMTPVQITYKVRDVIGDTNEALIDVCKDLELPKITTYSARHTFATIAYHKGASIEFIQEALGHSDSKTTRAYLKSFGMELKKQVSNWL